MMNRTPLALFTLSLFALGALAHGPLAVAEEVIYNDPLVINGNLQDQVAAERRKLEKENENLAKQKMEEIRIKEEKKMTDRLQSAFKDVGDKISGESAPTPTPTPTPTPAPTPAVVVAPATILEPPTPPRAHAFKVNPFLGGTVHQGRYENYQEKMGGGVDLAVAVDEDWSVGLLFDYGQMEISEVSSSQNWYTNWYLSNLGVAQSREIKAKRYSFAIVPRYYLLSSDSPVRPYVGAGAGYGQYDLKYKDANGYDSYRSYYSGHNVSYGNEEYSGSSLRGVAILGSEFNLSERFGFNLQCRYAKQITSLGASKRDYSAVQSIYNHDEQLIYEIGKDVQESHQLSFSLGMLFSF